MAVSENTYNMAVFCDLENIALGVQDARYAKFNIKKVIERLLLKGNIVTKKSYCDWDRYKGFKEGMHEAAFELIEIPHIRQSGKNSADIRMVVDALDLCYTKSHIDGFVIISGDSDFSPLVSKLRENNKMVIGVGVKNSSSDLLVANCDEFIFYDDIVREEERERRVRRPKPAETKPVLARPADPADRAEGRPDEEKKHNRRGEALQLVWETAEAILNERGGNGKVWGSMLKQTLRRRKPGFNESYYGFRSFGQLLEEAQTEKLLVMEKDEASGGYIVVSIAPNAKESENASDAPALSDSPPPVEPNGAPSSPTESPVTPD